MTKVGKLISKLTLKNVFIFGFILFLSCLLLYKIGSLVPGMSLQELDNIKSGLGWHGIYNNPLYLPIKLIRSTIITIIGTDSIFLNRVSSVIFGFIAVLCFASIVKVWHGTRTAIFATLLFMTSAWVLHASRTANYEVVYLSLIPIILFSNIVLHKYIHKPLIYILTIVIWGSILTIPGGIWFVLANSLMQKSDILQGWKNLSDWWHYSLIILAIAVWLPAIALIVLREAGVLAWVGLPDLWSSPTTVLKNLAGVPVHLFIRGPEDPFLWLGRAPILDLFTLVTSLIGIYYYVDHWNANRSRLLITLSIIGMVLVGLNGAVGISVIIPLLYIYAAMGIAYLSKQWSKVFPINPLARGVALGLMIVVVSLSCIYNLRSYFIAWPNNETTKVTFRYHP